jgi:hypothetical protein
MKKLLLALPFSVLLTACGSDSVEDIAHEYCIDIKQMNWSDAREKALDHIVSNREAMFEKNMGKYSSLFSGQNCNVTNVENDSETEATVYFGGSKLDSVMLELNEEEDRYIVVSDAFKNDLKLY